VLTGDQGIKPSCQGAAPQTRLSWAFFFFAVDHAKKRRKRKTNKPYTESMEPQDKNWL